MNNIKKYNNQAAYAAANRPVDESSVSLADGDVIVDGFNVIVPLQRGIAMPGDHLYYDIIGKSCSSPTSEIDCKELA